ncbi:MAG TPA: 3-dehydroquinate synthase, partial [Polyangiaceae bacterium]|nr:3-dehydroquinate synthase [Polyangiaceae bacterium]
FNPDNPDLARALGRREPEKRHRACFVIDAGVARAWPQLPEQIQRYAERHARTLELAGAPLVVPGGEQVKNDPSHIEALHREIARRGLDRQSFAVIVGGGAVQDMAGFAAATAHRGVRVVRLPTTVLSQNDSGVGVKNGINAFGLKNFVGSFAPPFAVINDARFLETLERRDRIAGIAEAVKVSLIRDAEFFEWLVANATRLRHFDAQATAFMVQRSAELHLRHIESGGDPFELGSARPLDFGHWSAHKLESLTAHGLRHGEAVAIGLALDTLVSVEVGLLSSAVAERVYRLLEELGLPTFHPELESVDAAGALKVLEGLREFREHLGGELTVTLLRAPGQAVDWHEMDPALIARAIRILRTRHLSADRTRLAADVVSGAAE